MEIRAAQSTDLETVRALLASADLTNTDVTAKLLTDFLVAAHADGTLLGCVGLERFDSDALLRSLAVSVGARGTGVGKALLQLAETTAASSGVSRRYLLTTTASDYFLNAGYRVAGRAAAPAELQASTQFSALCPATAVCLQKTLP
ncbi:amino-acid N-acetyltransferase [Paraburkholderia sp. BL23I1N1]|uniref:arsenic resistance N-acetyltransferase ArsN2 n=1 Tax=Paraburkholderia sp. BL23I1N1 TaxID=1938802 RepID=UPI000E72BEED|nr:arsenic resistance N-acetyltransferase ArsN2 [Paraburkholderia sp. BL23I1N1]RKE25230.1 amino-acid N-acetyltransferase [Paraburkholderia sp. BL23I1N1]